MNLKDALDAIEARWHFLVGPIVWLLIAATTGLFLQRWRGITPKIMCAGALLALAAEIAVILPTETFGTPESDAEQWELAATVHQSAWLASQLGLICFGFGFLMFVLGLPRTRPTKHP